MIRGLYRLLLLAHPPAFRREFAPDILWIFDETGPSIGLFADAFASLLRQWLRPALWIPVVTCVVACIGALLPLIAGISVGKVIRNGLQPANHTLKVDFYVVAVLAVLAAIACTMTICIAWFQYQKRRYR